MDAQTVISVKDLTISLGGRKILENVSFNVAKGEFVAILGPNGAGKTTILKLLLGIIKPTTGTITVLSKTPTRGNSAIGYAPQHRVLETDLALRARDVVGFGLDGNKWGISLPSSEREEKIDKALTEVDALRFGNAPVGRLSGGEQQRLLIAQAIITNPQILLLDEPLSNLDINHARGIVDVLTKLKKEQKITIVLVSHDINPLLPAVDEVLFMARGHSAMGKPDEVITSETLSELYNAEVEVIRAKNRVFVTGAEI
ncbi:MAG: ABC transporter ATP-binding protein [Candidatus Levyibacteriota bacterium]|jgi:zinc/manganese transport system ATP-binding protein